MLADSEDFMILARIVLIELQGVTDRQTDAFATAKTDLHAVRTPCKKSNHVSVCVCVCV